MKKLFDYLIGQLDNPWFWVIVVLTMIAITITAAIRNQIKKAQRPSVYAILTPPVKRKSKFWDLFRKKGTTGTNPTPPTPSIREQMRKHFSLLLKWISSGAQRNIVRLKVRRRLNRIRKSKFRKSLSKEAKFLNGNLVGRYNAYKFVSFTISIIPFIIFPAMWGFKETFFLGFTDMPRTYFLLSLWTTYLLSSIRTLGVDEIGGISFFGMPIWNLTRGSGPKLILIGLFQFGKVKGGIHQIELPAEPENVWKKSDEVFPGGLSPNGKPWVRPIRIPTASPKTANYSLGTRIGVGGTKDVRYTEKSLKGEKLHKQMVLENNGTIRYQVEDDEYFYFKRNFLSSFRKLVKQLRDGFESALKKMISVRTPAMIIADRDIIDDGVETELRELFEGKVGTVKDPESRPGVRFLNAQYLEPDLTHSVSIELANFVAAPLKAETKTILGKADNTIEEDQELRVGGAKNKNLDKEYSIRTGNDMKNNIEVTRALAYQNNETVEVYAPDGDGKILVKHGGN